MISKAPTQPRIVVRRGSSTAKPLVEFVGPGWDTAVWDDPETGSSIRSATSGPLPLTAASSFAAGLDYARVFGPVQSPVLVPDDPAAPTGFRPVLIPDPFAERSAAERRSRPKAVAMLMVALLVAGSAFFLALSGHRRFDLSERVSDVPEAAPATSAVRPSSPAAVHWLLANAVGRRLLVDEATAGALIGTGWPDEALERYDDHGNVLVAKASVNQMVDLVVIEPRSGMMDQPPSHLAGALWSSVAVAEFADGATLVEIRETIPGGPITGGPARLAAQQARVAAGDRLLGSGSVSVTDRTERVLRSGVVDTDLLDWLSTLVAKHQISIVGFPALAGETGSGAIRRAVEIAEIDGRPVIGANGVTAVLSSAALPSHPGPEWIRRSEGPDLPATVTAIFQLPAQPA